MEPQDTHNDSLPLQEKADADLKSLMQGHGQGFHVPQDYFEDLQQSIVQKLTSEPRVPEFKKNSLYSLWVWAAAAVITAGLIAFFILLSGEGKKQSMEQFSQGLKSKEKILQTLKKDTHDRQITKSITMESIQPIKVQSSSLPAETPQKNANADTMTKSPEITNDDIIDYLLEEDFDLSDLSN